MVIEELRNYEPKRQARKRAALETYIVERKKMREEQVTEGARTKLSVSPAPRPPRPAPARPRRPAPLLPPRYLDRRGTSLLPVTTTPREKRRSRERRRNQYAIPFPDRRLTRSAYEQVFLKLVSGGRLSLGGELYRPVGMKGWYHAIFRSERSGEERLLTIDQLLQKMNDWL
jgi:hypothetical protein